MITSSNTSSAPDASHSCRSTSRKPSAGRDDAHVPGDRLDDDRREPLAVAQRPPPATASTSLYGQTIVSAVDRRRHAGRRRDAERREPGARAREQRVGVAVVAAGELEDAVALREAAREPQRAHRRLGARRDEPHLLDRRHRVGDLRGELDLRLGRRAEASCRRSAASRTASTVSGSACPKSSGPHDSTQSR